MSELHTQEMLLNMGPQHPSTHGVIRFVVKTDGEVMSTAIPDVGYLHRSIEKIAEKATYHGFMPWTDRVDYLAAMNCNYTYALAVEKLSGIETSRRAEYLRVISMELNRIISHLLAVGALGMDVGAYTPFIHGLREREKVNDLIEELCGQRLTYNYARVGGVIYDMPSGWAEKVLAFLDQFAPMVDEFNRLLTDNKILKNRLGGIGVISKEDAIAYNLVGPNLRGSGLKWDLRKDLPYSVYPEFEFDVPVGTGEAGTLGDCFDRYMVRIREMGESVKILRQCFEKIPSEGEPQVKVPKKIRPPAGEIYVRTESTRGDLGCYLVSDGGDKPYRLKFRAGSFNAMSIVEKVSRGMMVADLIAFIASLDIVAPEIDR
ncbi:MAG: NADH-quinone oxidoreductase subunit D [Deltaproteobacteria bacterium]|nr:NADH-quinone oxidoreductase subunit D [Deltaproteobacteria bacterium]MBI2501492.1 NADH-quinone oxidoreductase subunit D [Deltaproteobacteria bacterium]